MHRFESICTTVMIVSVIMLGGCGGESDSGGSANAPSESQIEAAIKQDVEAGSDNKVKVLSVKRIDDKSNEGAGLHLAKVEVDLEVLEDFSWGVLKAVAGMSPTIKESRESYEPVLKKGEVLKLKTTARMTKFLSGWKLEQSPRFQPRS